MDELGAEGFSVPRQKRSDGIQIEQLNYRNLMLELAKASSCLESNQGLLDEFSTFRGKLQRMVNAVGELSYA